MKENQTMKTETGLDASISAESIAADVAECVRVKVFQAITRQLDAGKMIAPYGNELAVSNVINEYMNNPSDAVARDAAEACCQWPVARGGNEPDSSDAVTHGENCGCKSFDDCPAR